MKLADDEVRALAFIAALITLTLLGRWVDRPRPLAVDAVEVDVAARVKQNDRVVGGGTTGGGTTGGGTDGGVRAGEGARRAPSQLDLNGASASELERLPGIGPALASRIVEYRELKGRFGTLEELDSVKGIGPAMLARLKPLLRL